jgi:transposase
LSEPEAERKLMNREEICGMYAQGEEAVIALVEGLLEQIKKLGERIEVLESQASKTSGNSSKPPSGDGFVKRTKSLREKSDKKSRGHQGRTLEWSEEVSTVVEHRVNQCEGCGASLEQVPVETILLRQVHDIPVIELKVSEHRAEVKVCPHCDQKSEGQFPSEASNLVQYGSRLKGMMVYLMEGQLLPSKRTCEVLKDLLGVEVSEGTIYNAREQCFKMLAPITQGIKDTVTGSSVVSFDETGLRVNLKLWWLHVGARHPLMRGNQW